MGLPRFDWVRAPVVVVDRDGVVRGWSDACATRTGRAAEEACGRPLEDFLDRDSGRAFRSSLSEHATPTTLDVRMLGADGTPLAMRLLSTPVRDSVGQVEASVLTVLEVGSGPGGSPVGIESAFHELFEQAADGIFIADLDGRYTDVNSAGSRMLGHERGALVGKSIVDLIAPEEVSRLIASKERMLRGEIDVGEWELKRADGTWLPVDLSAKILADGRWLAFVRDITERKLASEALAASEARIRQIVSSAVDAIISIDESHRIVMFNEGAEQIFGFRACELLGQRLDRLLPERFRASHQAWIAAFTASGVTSRAMASRSPVRALRRNGEEFSAQASISQVVDRGHRIMTVVLRDVSAEVRALEEERFLGEISAVLASSLDVAITVDELSRLAVRDIADFCVVDVVHGTNTRVLRAASREGTRAELVAATEAKAADLTLRHPGSNVWITGEPELVAHVTDEVLGLVGARDAYTSALAAMKPCSFLAVPMRARGHLVGVLTLLTESRVYDRRDLRFAVDVASRAAIALDNASLHDALRRAHADVAERLRELEEAQEKIRTLTGLLPVCAWCGLIRDDDDAGTWKRFDQYVSEHSSAEVTHGICPSCAARLGKERTS